MMSFMKGVNLGGWLSQYPVFDHDHFTSFITRNDVNTIASWGMDHVRLPLDYPVLESDDAVGKYHERGFQYIDDCIEWCEAAGLGIVIDLHHAPGYSFNNTLQAETMHLNSLFLDPATQSRFVDLWTAIVNRYKKVKIPVLFELLNEVVLPDSEPWNDLAQRTVNTLQRIAPECHLVIGSNNYNAASELKNLSFIDDPSIHYTFHFYEPFLFTHQKAYWSDIVKEYDQDLVYPGEFVNLEEFLSRAPEYRGGFAWLINKPLDQELMYEFLQPALDFKQDTDCDLYCGEYGVIESADPQSRRHWHADLLYKLKEHSIGGAVWSYKEMDFGLVDSNGLVRDEELLAILCD